MIGHLLALLFCLGCCIWVGYVLTRAAQENHHRGQARVHRGTSWTSKVPEQRTSGRF